MEKATGEFLLIGEVGGSGRNPTTQKPTTNALQPIPNPILRWSSEIMSSSTVTPAYSVRSAMELCEHLSKQETILRRAFRNSLKTSTKLKTITKEGNKMHAMRYEYFIGIEKQPAFFS